MQIRKLQPPQEGKTFWTVQLENGHALQIGEGEVVSFGLYAGMELEEDQLSALQEAAARSAVRTRALDLLSARPLSRKELLQKLTARPRQNPARPNQPPKPAVKAEDAQAAADWLEELGYLDDAAYARSVVQHYAAKGYGPRRLQDELFRRGVDREHWDQALETLPEPDNAIDAFLQKRLGGQEALDRKDLKRASDALVRRGFRYEEIRDGLRRYEEFLEEQENPF